jgi:hypothetical protein
MVNRKQSAIFSRHHHRAVPLQCRASLRSGDAFTHAIQGNVRYAASQLTDRSAVLKKAAASGKVTLL